jgi:hypothetical protein
VERVRAAGAGGPGRPPGPARTGRIVLGGPPFVWVCTPASYPQAGSGPRADLYVFNGSSTTANVAVHILDKDGNNLAGVNIPGSAPAQSYPGETGAATVAVAPSNTRIVTWVNPDTSLGCCTNVSMSVRVVSDQPITVGSNFQFSGFIPLPCSFLHN